MNQNSHGGWPPDEPADDALLDPGLRAAYGPSSVAMGQSGESILATIERSAGVSAHVLLRDEPDAPAGPVHLSSAQVPVSAGGIGRYQVAGEIARGGVGVVLKGRDIDLGREIALKVLRSEHAGNPAMIRRFIEEAQIGGQLQHPGVLPVYEMGVDAALRPFFAMKLVRGRTLAALLHDRAKKAEETHRLLTIFVQVCQAVAYAHARGVIHRDLKPSNVMVGTFGEVQVVDWGLAKVLAQGGIADEARANLAEPETAAVATIRSGAPGTQSEAGSVFGTPAYMAPEQARGLIDDLDERCDVFALGAMLSEILTGSPPYTGNRAETLRQARAGSLDGCFAQLDRCGADAELVAIAKRCLDPARAVRFRDASELAHAVTAYLASVAERMHAAELSAVAATSRAGAERRAKRLTVALAGVLLASMLIGGATFVDAERTRARAAQERARADASQARAQAEAARATAVRAQADAERARQLEAALAVIGSFRTKSAWIIDQARSAPDSQAAVWAQCLALTRQAVERAETLSADAPTREQRQRILEDLRTTEAELRQKAEHAKQQPEAPHQAKH